MFNAIAAAAAAALLVQAAPAPKMTKLPNAQAADARLIRASNTTCFKTGENQEGMTKICFYDCLGSPAAITVSATQLCPLSIKR